MCQLKDGKQVMRLMQQKKFRPFNHVHLSEFGVQATSLQLYLLKAIQQFIQCLPVAV